MVSKDKRTCFNNYLVNPYYRLNFDKFDIGQPATTYPADAVPNSRGSCNQARFTAESDGPTPPVICGTNTGRIIFKKMISTVSGVNKMI